MEGKERGDDREDFMRLPLFKEFRSLADPFRWLLLLPLLGVVLSEEDNPHVKAAKRELLLALKEELEREVGEGETPPRHKKISVE